MAQLDSTQTLDTALRATRKRPEWHAQTRMSLTERIASLIEQRAMPTIRRLIAEDESG